MSNSAADTETTAERNFRTGILAGAGNKASIGRTGYNVERNAARNPYGRTVALRPVHRAGKKGNGRETVAEEAQG